MPAVAIGAAAPWLPAEVFAAALWLSPALADGVAGAVVTADPLALALEAELEEPVEPDEAADAVDEAVAAQDAWVGTLTP